MTDIIMVRGRVSNRVGDALSRMLEGSKPRQAGHVATAGEQVSPPAHAPQPSPSPEPLSPPSLHRGSPAGDDDTHPSSPASFLDWDREEIRTEYSLEEISEFEAILALTKTGMNVCDAMNFLDSWS